MPVTLSHTFSKIRRSAGFWGANHFFFFFRSQSFWEKGNSDLGKSHGAWFEWSYRRRPGCLPLSSFSTGGLCASCVPGSLVSPGDVEMRYGHRFQRAPSLVRGQSSAYCYEAAGHCVWREQRKVLTQTQEEPGGLIRGTSWILKVLARNKRGRGKGLPSRRGI